MTPFVEDITRWAVIVFYAAVVAAAVNAHIKTRLWARKLATVALAAAAAGWIVFYLGIAHHDISYASDVVLWSRIFHYNTATWLFISASIIRRSDKDGIAVAMSREHQ